MRQTLAALREARHALLRGDPYTVYNSDASGYYYDASQVDGYEELFSLAELNALTVERFDELTAAPPLSQPGFAVGKMASGSRWYLAIGQDAAYAAHFEEGVRYAVRYKRIYACRIIQSRPRIFRAGCRNDIAALYHNHSYHNDDGKIDTKRIAK